MSKSTTTFTTTRPPEPIPDAQTHQASTDFPLWLRCHGRCCRKSKGTYYYSLAHGTTLKRADARYRLWEEAGRPSQVPQLDNIAVENSSTKASQLPKRRKGFPLWPHPNGQWAKRIDGGIRYFGIWDDEEGALEEYHNQLRPGLAVQTY